MLFFIQCSNAETINYLLHATYFDIAHRYVTELNPDVMKCMAGFSSDEEYYVPRSELAFPDWTNHHDVTTLLFPSIIRWQQEQLHGLGDHSEAAKNFLHEVLPFLATVIFQDGIYWVTRFPNHEASRLLLNIMPATYERWAAAARQEVESKLVMLKETHIQTLNVAAQQVFLHIMKELKEIKMTQHELSEQLATNNTGNAIPPVLPTQGIANTTIDEAAQQEASNQHRTAFDALRSSPCIPSFPVPLPNLMEELLQQHDDIYKLEDYRHAKKQFWPGPLRQAFSKRMYLYQKIEEKAARS